MGAVYFTNRNKPAYEGLREALESERVSDSEARRFLDSYVSMVFLSLGRQGTPRENMSMYGREGYGLALLIRDFAGFMNPDQLEILGRKVVELDTNGMGIRNILQFYPKDSTMVELCTKKIISIGNTFLRMQESEGKERDISLVSHKLTVRQMLRFSAGSLNREQCERLEKHVQKIDMELDALIRNRARAADLRLGMTVKKMAEINAYRQENGMEAEM